jgi:hypothetical protein
MAPPSSPRLSRRHFLAAGGLAAGAALLGACGGGDDDDEESTDGTAAPERRGLALAAFFGGPMFIAGTPFRAPFGVVDRDGLLAVDDTPDHLEVQVLTGDDQPVGDPITLARHAQDLPRAYFPLETTIAEPGFYTLRSEVDGERAELSFEVTTADQVKVIQPGVTMPALQTPTTADAAGVNPICTRNPACALHDVTLADALGVGSPIAFLVSTPGYCQLSICGPVLDVLLGVAEGHPEVKLLHQEVYKDPAVSLTEFAPGLAELGLHFEPCLILVGADGKVAERLDIIFDTKEVDEALSRLTA